MSKPIIYAPNKKPITLGYRLLAQTVGFAVCCGLRLAYFLAFAAAQALLPENSVPHCFLYGKTLPGSNPPDLSAPNKKPITLGYRLLAETVGFEPTCRLNTDKTISSRSRYDHFDTSPYINYIIINIFSIKINSDKSFLLQKLR